MISKRNKKQKPEKKVAEIIKIYEVNTKKQDEKDRTEQNQGKGGTALAAVSQRASRYVYAKAPVACRFETTTKEWWMH